MVVSADISNLECIADVDECSGVTCENGGTCVDGINGYTCSCVAGFTGTHCETGNFGGKQKEELMRFMDGCLTAKFCVCVPFRYK